MFQEIVQRIQNDTSTGGQNHFPSNRLKVTTCICMDRRINFGILGHLPQLVTPVNADVFLVFASTRKVTKMWRSWPGHCYRLLLDEGVWIDRNVEIGIKPFGLQQYAKTCTFILWNLYYMWLLISPTCACNLFRYLDCKTCSRCFSQLNRFRVA